MKIGVIFGGMSTENEVSVVSATSVIKNLDNNKYKIKPIYISKQGKWYICKEDLSKLKLGDKPKNLIEIENITKELQECETIFPVLHGLYGEDGTIQGMLKLLKIPYVGCGVLASSVGMDKIYTKILFKTAGLEITPYIYVKKLKQNNNKNTFKIITQEFNEQEKELKDICNDIISKIRWPIFVKPSNSGSSVGVKKANNVEKLENAIINAGKYDDKIIVEQGIEGKEVECAVLGNDNVVASCVGEIVPAEEFYSFDAKYIDENSKTLIPANLEKNISEEIRKQAIKAFKSIDGKGLARVDFFVEKTTNKIYINEINTMPGFTNISMYPKLFEESGIKYSELLDRLILLAKE